MLVVFIGGPGSGKGTQAKLLADELPLVCVSMGGILRESIVDGSKYGTSYADSLLKGSLVPDETVIPLFEVWFEKALSLESSSGIIVDGFPRTLTQAKYLDGLLEKKNLELKAIIHLELDDDTLYKRNVGRRSCSCCGKDFNMFFDPPRRDEWCDLCGSKLIQRDDSSVLAIRNRISEYRSKTIPVISHYEGKGSMLAIDGGKAKKDIHERIVKELRCII